MSVHGPKPAVIPDITIVCGGNVDVSDHKQDQTAIYYKIPDVKYAVRDSGYSREQEKIVFVEDDHNVEFKE